MNLVLFDRSELVDSSLMLSDERARHILEVHRATPGRVLRIGEINGRIGQGKVVAIKDSSVTLEVSLTESSPPNRAVDIVLALCRPQMLKRILETVAVFRIRRLWLVSSARVEKSYFHSPLLRSENIRTYLLRGLSQGMSTQLPEVKIERSFREFLDSKDFRSVSSNRWKLLPDFGSEQDLLEIFNGGRISESEAVAIAIGPEGGWVEEEVASFVNNAFYKITLAGSVLRVETALCAMLSQLELLYRTKRPSSSGVDTVFDSAIERKSISEPLVRYGS